MRPGQSGCGGHAGHPRPGHANKESDKPCNGGTCTLEPSNQCKSRGWTAAYKELDPCHAPSGLSIRRLGNPGAAPARLSPLRSALGYSVWPLQGRKCLSPVDGHDGVQAVLEERERQGRGGQILEQAAQFALRGGRGLLAGRQAEPCKVHTTDLPSGAIWYLPPSGQ